MKKIIPIVLAAAITPITALAQPIVARVSWDPNPESENVGWYIMEWFNGQSQTWSMFAQDSGTLVDGRLRWAGQINIPQQIPIGTTICVRLIAAKSNERSQRLSRCVSSSQLLRAPRPLHHPA